MALAEIIDLDARRRAMKTAPAPSLAPAPMWCWVFVPCCVVWTWTT